MEETLKTCKLEYCDNETTRVLCGGHRTQHERGKPLTPIAPKQSLEERLWAKVDKTESCWLWTGSLKSSGYGQINIDRTPRAAHRISYEIHKGPIPAGMFVDHLCHERRCVNPDHLRLVTLKQNAEHRAGPQRNNTSGVLGVSWNGKKWFAKVEHHKRQYYVGLFDDLNDAEVAVIAKRTELFTHNDRDKAAV